MKKSLLKIFGVASFTTVFSFPSHAQGQDRAEVSEESSESDVVNPFAVQTYARQLASQIAGRPLSPAERAKIKAEGEAALADLVKTWVSDPFFAKTFRARIEMLIATSGERDGVDFNLPGNLAQYIVEQKLPFSEIITAAYCIDGKGAKVPCDTGAPFAAGVIGTRGYLMATAGRFNLGRANAMMSAFACSHYPMSEKLQPRIPKSELITNFRISSEEEAKQAGSTGFGNGSECYSCHGQFAAQTQFFVKFDQTGLYKADATGLPSKTLEFGRSDKGLYSSHFIDEMRSANEMSDMFGLKAANLSEGMKLLAENPVFLRCMVKQVVTHAFNLDSEASNKISSAFMGAIAESIPRDQATVAKVYEAVLTHHEMVKAFSRGVVAP